MRETWEVDGCVLVNGGSLWDEMNPSNWLRNGHMSPAGRFIFPEICIQQLEGRVSLSFPTGTSKDGAQGC